MLTDPDMLTALAEYVLGFTFGTKGKGAKLLSRGTVTLEQDEDGAFVGKVAHRKVDTVTLNYDRDEAKWIGECTCIEGGDCAHCYAAAKSLMDGKGLRSSQVVQQPRVRRAPEASFEKLVTQKLGRTLSGGESQYARHVDELYKR